MDTNNWSRFIESVKQHYKDDAQVEILPSHILFKAGEHPRLPFEGHKFLRFSPNVSGRIATESGVWSYINTVKAFAKAEFGLRIQSWSECADQLGYYSWREVNESFRSYEQVCRLFVCL